MKFKDLNHEIKSKFVRDTLFELYPFTIEDFQDFESYIDFKIISKNQYIDWSVEIIEKYLEKWDWSEIENNPIVCKEVNLGLLYPEKVNIEKPRCTCYKELDYCNMKKYRNSEYDRTKMIKKKVNCLSPYLYGYIKFLIDEKVINKGIMSNILLYNMDINVENDYDLDDGEIREDNDYSDLPF